MTRQPQTSPLLFLIGMAIGAAIRQIVRHPYLSASVVAHIALLTLLYYFGNYQPELREQEAEVAASVRATTVASTAKRLQDLQTIKQLLEKSADRLDNEPEPSPDAAAPPQTPEEMVARARETSQAIEALDEKIQAEELAKLTERSKPPPAAEKTAANNNAYAERKNPGVPESRPQTPDAQANQQRTNDGPAAHDANASTQANITPEQAADEVAKLEAKARTTLARRQQQLEARANGVQVEGSESQSGSKGSGSQNGVGNASVRAEIDEFMGAGRSTEETTGSGRYSSLNFFDGGNSEIPPVDASSLVPGRGRMIGAGGEYANRLYLNSWYVIGPFPGRHEGGLFDNPAYPPEKAVLLDAAYYGKDKRLLQWRYVTSREYPFYPPDMAEDSVYYGYTEVFVDQACDLTAWIGVDDDVQIYLNDQQVWKGGNVNKRPYFDAIFNTDNTYLRDYNRTEGKRLVHFNKGRNKIFFKMSNGPNKAFLSMVLTR